MITVRPTNFNPAGSGGTAEVSEIDASKWFSTIGGKFIENIVMKSDLPELTSA